MIGELVFLVVLVVLALLVMWLSWQQVKAARTAAEIAHADADQARAAQAALIASTQDAQLALVAAVQEPLLELVNRQAALIAADDALAYQALRAMDVTGSYDDGSTAPDTEENADGFGADRDAEEAGQGGDPFMAGNIFNADL